MICLRHCLWLLRCATMVVGIFPGGGGPWNVVCNSSAACPVDQTCCRLASENWGCCPAPLAVCCPGGATCCPHGYACTTHGGISNGCELPKSQGSVQKSVKVQAQHHENVEHSNRFAVAHASFSTQYLSRSGGVVSVASVDGKANVTIHVESGEIVSVQSGNVRFPVRGRTVLGGFVNASMWEVTVFKKGFAVHIECILKDHVKLIQTFSPDVSDPSAIEWKLVVMGLTSTPFTLPVSSTFAFPETMARTDLAWWAPWDRMSYTDRNNWVNPLLPSDGKTGFWNGTYSYGRVYAGGPHSQDMVVAPLVAVLHKVGGRGFSVQMHPGEPGLAWSEQWMQSFDTEYGAGFAWHREQLRLSVATLQTFTAHIVPHEDCWRPALAFHVNRYRRHWNRVADRDKVAAVDGLGSYGSFPIPQLGETGDLSDPLIAKMHYKVNWDLGGRFYHYMGMFAPPVDGGAPTSWLNRWNPFGSNGGRLTYNVSYNQGPWNIDALYAQAQSLGFATLSYCNVFEFGMNIDGHASGPPAPKKPDDYRNATLYAQNYLGDSILRSNWNAQDGKTAPNQGAWDGGILMDPARESYKHEMVQQTARRIANIPHFQGVVVDRSDYARFYNLEHDDGITLTGSPGTSKSWSMKRSYLEVINSIRGVLGNEHVMLMNSLGYSSLSFMLDFDGTFSEGKAFNAVGILGAAGMVNIMWTSSSMECCHDEAAADVYFQRRLFMGVYPLAPLPDADHCITKNATITPWFVNYGPLFAALQGKTFNLQPHPVEVIAPLNRGIAVNAFLQGDVHLYPVVLVPTSSVTLRLHSLPQDVVGFEAIFPGDNMGIWSPISNAHAIDNRSWEITLNFADGRELHAAILRSRSSGEFKWV